MEAQLPRRVKGSVRDDGILHCVYGAGADVSTEDAAEVLDWVVSQCQERRRLVLADTSTIRSMSRGARTIFAESADPLAVAVLVKSMQARVIGNFFLGLIRPKVPMKLFSDEDAALQWLKEHLRE